MRQGPLSAYRVNFWNIYLNSLGYRVTYWHWSMSGNPQIACTVLPQLASLAEILRLFVAPFSKTVQINLMYEISTYVSLAVWCGWIVSQGQHSDSSKLRGCTRAGRSPGFGSRRRQKSLFPFFAKGAKRQGFLECLTTHTNYRGSSGVASRHVLLASCRMLGVSVARSIL